MTYAINGFGDQAISSLFLARRLENLRASLHLAVRSSPELENQVWFSDENVECQTNKTHKLVTEGAWRLS